VSGRAAAAGRAEESGFSLVMVVAAITIMLILMGAAVPSWRYVMKNAREEELIFRGGQIAEAIERYQKKHGGVPPRSLEDLVKGKFLRKAWPDPMTRDGKWRLVRQGEVLNQRLGRPGGPGGPLGGPGRRLANRFGEDIAGGGRGERGGLGGFVGVATTLDEESYRIFNGQTKYDEWLFVAGQPRVVGRPPIIPGGNAKPGVSPAPGEAGPQGPGGKDQPGGPLKNE
jgi:type II secretory pathway pseudopilin PulG